MIEVKMGIIGHFYIEKRKTLQLYHIVHQGDCNLLPHTSGRLYLGKFTDLEEMIEVTRNPISEIQQCQLCLKAESKLNL